MDNVSPLILAAPQRRKFGAPPPVAFPDPATVESANARREAVRLGSQARQAEALRAAMANGHEAGHQLGYVEGTHVGLWIGACLGCLASGIVVAGVYAVRTWLAAL